MKFSLSEKQFRESEVERAAVEAAWRRPDSIIVDHPDWFQITTPSSKQFWLNRVIRSRLSADQAPARIAETISHYRRGGQSFIWILGPSATPSNLAQMLVEQGLKPDHSGLGMVADVENIKITDAPDVTVERVTLSNVQDYAQACVQGWGNPQSNAEEIASDMIRSIQDPSHKVQYFVGKYKGTSAASGALLPLTRSGYLLGSSVVPEFRGKGVYRALVGKRIETLRSLGIPLATVQAIATTSAPICERLGFEAVCEIHVYKWVP